MNHEIEVSNLMFNKTSNEEISFKKYDINVDLEEETSNEQKTVLKYSIDLTSNPKNSVINISGNTILSGEQSEIEDFLKQENEKIPEIVSLIYQELFPLMYIISKNMKIPSPAHTISQNNVKEPEQKNEKLDMSNDKPVETKPVETKPVETKPVETKPVETKPVETKPVETKPTDSTKEVNEAAQSINESEDDKIKNNMEPNVKEEPNDEVKTQ
jgi:hypothetical protein